MARCFLIFLVATAGVHSTSLRHQDDSQKVLHHSTADISTPFVTKNSSTTNGNHSYSGLLAHHLRRSHYIQTDQDFNYVLLGVVIAIPLILLPILFLFARSATNGEQESQEGDHDNFQCLSEPVVLLPTMPGYDSFLADSSSWGPIDAPVVTVDKSSGRPYYLLQPGATLFRPQTGQLYHAATGLLFNPIMQRTFDPKSGHVVNTENNLHLPAHPNLVYMPQNNWLFERSFALSFSPQPDKQIGTWSLPRSPVASSDMKVDPIRRVRPEELPDIFAQHYVKLLAKWQASGGPSEFLYPVALLSLDSHSSKQLESAAEPETANTARNQSVYWDTCSRVLSF